VESLARVQSHATAPAGAHRCLLCRENNVRPLADFGSQPPSNRFEFIESREIERHPLLVGQCQGCGLLQLITPMSPAMVKPRFNWLTYNEPENHLDQMVEKLCLLPELNAGKRIAGVTYKDDTTLVRFNRSGYANTYRYNPAEDLGVSDRCSGLETIQSVLAARLVADLTKRLGFADLLIARHILEHAHEPLGLLAALGNLVTPDGYLLIEVPSCTKFIRACDYSFVWEEHITYFSPATLSALINRAGLTLHEMLTYPYPFEDSLIAIIRNKTPHGHRQPQDIRPLLEDGAVFSRRYAGVREEIRSRLQTWRQHGKRIAIFGAGHLAAKFINFYALDGLIECVIDDHERKREMLMPGSRVPIRSAEALSGIDICLLSLNPESEQKVMARHKDFGEAGGRFLSIFALSPHSVYRENFK
jgi:C-methyltransferase C-terminal domain/Methyltransferase domain/Putative zinc binding domain